MRSQPSRLDRRTFLLGAASVVAPGAAPSQSFVAAHGLPIGLQLYTLGADIRDDLEGTLSALARIGFKTVETAGFLGRAPAQFRKALDAAGLKCTAAHVQAVGEGPDGSFSIEPGKLAETLHALGAAYAVLPVPRMPERLGGPAPGENGGVFLRRALTSFTVDDWRANAEFLNTKAKALKAHDIKVAYHNHNPEFRPVGGTNGLEILIQNTDPDLVTFELDAGWAMAAGIDPIAFLNKHKGRFSLMHVKDIKATTKTNFEIAQDPAEVGAGIIPWPKLLPAAYAAGVRNLFIEQEPPFARPRLEAVKISYDYLSRVPA